MNIILKPGFILQKRHLFPFSHKTHSHHRYRVIIGLGGNVGNVYGRFKIFLNYIKTHPKMTLRQSAPLLKNPPFGFTEQPDFLNTVIIIQTSLSPHELLHFLMKTEKKFGRIRLFKDGPRTLDLDIILFETKTVYNKKLQIPHPCWQTRSSVLVPMMYLQ